MIKKTVQYTDYNGKAVTEDVYFHLKIDKLTDNLNLGDELEEMQRMFDGNTRELTTPEKQQILDLVKRFVNLSYGVRVDGGAKFRQRPELLEDFRDSAGYDAFLWALFQDPAGAMSFLNDVMPQELIAEARAAQDAGNGRPQPQDRLPKAVRPVETVSASVLQEKPAEVDDEVPPLGIARETWDAMSDETKQNIRDTAAQAADPTDS